MNEKQTQRLKELNEKKKLEQEEQMRKDLKDSYDRILKSKDIRINELEVQISDMQVRFADRMNQLAQERDYLLKQQSGSAPTQPTTRSAVIPAGDIHRDIIKKLHQGDMLYGSIEMFTPMEDLAFFNTRDLIIRVHPISGRKLTPEEICIIRKHLEGNYYYNKMLEAITSKRKRLESILDQCKTSSGQPAASIDTTSIIEEANHYGWILLYQYNKLF